MTHLLYVHIFITLLPYGHIFIRNVKSTTQCSLIRGPYSKLWIRHPNNPTKATEHHGVILHSFI